MLTEDLALRTAKGEVRVGVIRKWLEGNTPLMRQTFVE